MKRILSKEDFQIMIERYNLTYPSNSLKGPIRDLWWSELSLMDGQAVQFAFNACIGDEHFAFKFGKVITKAREWLKSHRSEEARHDRILPKHQPFPKWLLKAKAIEEDYKDNKIDYDEFEYKWIDCWRENHEVWEYSGSVVTDRKLGTKEHMKLQTLIEKRLAEIKRVVEFEKKPKGDVSYGLNFGDIPDNRKKELV